MCGIAVIINALKNDPFDHECMEKMVHSLSHRGPDGNGIYRHNGITMGHTRLSIIDLSEKGHQPMHYENLSIVFNGEIYNFKELRKELENLGYGFKTNTDTEVILIGYREWGTELFKKLSGMFAFCIYNQTNGETIIVRDPFGIKPIYFYKNDNRFIFSSEIKAIQKTLSPSQLTIDKESVQDILQYLYVQGTRTIYSEISRLKPGTYIRINGDSLDAKHEKYWKLERSEHYVINYEEAQSKVEELLTDSINENMVSDVPVGLFLSGGIDSSLVCAIASKHTPQPLHTFSLGYTESGKFMDESKDAQRVAHKFKTIHHTKTLDIIETMNGIESIIKNMDAPNADASVFLNHIISEYASNYVKVCMSGLGGDELFGGYNRYQAMLLNPLFSRLPHTISNWLLKNNQIITSRTNKFGNLNRALKKIIESSDKDPGIAYQNLITYQKFENKPISLNYRDLNDVMIWDIENYMVNDLLSLTDQMSMASSLEVRVPFLNTKLTEMAFQISPKHKISLTSKKIILKKVAAKYLDDEIINKRKQGFSAPIEIWLKKHNADYFISSFINGPIRGFVDNQIIRTIVNGFYKERKDYSNQLYALYVLNCWLDK